MDNAKVPLRTRVVNVLRAPLRGQSVDGGGRTLVQERVRPSASEGQLRDLNVRGVRHDCTPSGRGATPVSSGVVAADERAIASDSGRRQHVVIVDFGMGNLHSLRRKLDAMCSSVTISADPAVVGRADKLVMPGVGHFGRAMENLRSLHLVDALNEAARVRRVPTLGICLGMQLMARRSEEGGAEGLGWVDADVVRIRVSDKLRHKIPHVGYARITAERQSLLLKDLPDDAEFYFVHSYNLQARQPDLVLCESIYAHPFTSAIEHGNLFGVQFHPEKSQRVGDRLLRNFVEL